MMRQYYVYIMASERNGTLYIGVTNDLIRRACQHRHNLLGGFTAKYRVHRLVYCEVHEDIGQALMREKQMKKWRRQWKLRLIEKENPDWADLYDRIVGAQPAGANDVAFGKERSMETGFPPARE